MGGCGEQSTWQEAGNCPKIWKKLKTQTRVYNYHMARASCPYKSQHGKRREIVQIFKNKGRKHKHKDMHKHKHRHTHTSVIFLLHKHNNTNYWSQYIQIQERSSPIKLNICPKSTNTEMAISLIKKTLTTGHIFWSQLQIHWQPLQSMPIIDPNTNIQAATWSEQCRSYMVTREITARLRRISFETRGEDRPRSKRTIETPRI